MRTAFLIPVAALLLGACQPATDPAVEARAALEAYYEANLAEDWPRVWEMISRESRASQNDDYEIFVEPLRDTGMIFSRAITRRTSHEIRETRVEGDRAEIDVAVRMPSLARAMDMSTGLSLPAIEEAPLVEHEVTMTLLREDGAWKVERPMATPEERSIEERRRRAELERRRRAGLPAEGGAEDPAAPADGSPGSR